MGRRPYDVKARYRPDMNLVVFIRPRVSQTDTNIIVAYRNPTRSRMSNKSHVCADSDCTFYTRVSNVARPHPVRMSRMAVTCIVLGDAT